MYSLSRPSNVKRNQFPGGGCYSEAANQTPLSAVPFGSAADPVGTEVFSLYGFRPRCSFGSVSAFKENVLVVCGYEQVLDGDTHSIHLSELHVAVRYHSGSWSTKTKSYSTVNASFRACIKWSSDEALLTEEGRHVRWGHEGVHVSTRRTRRVSRSNLTVVTAVITVHLQRTTGIVKQSPQKKFLLVLFCHGRVDKQENVSSLFERKKERERCPNM